ARERFWYYAVPEFSSPKSMTGPTTSATGAIESVVCLLAMREGFMPCNLGLRNPLHPEAKPVDTSIGHEGAAVEIRHVVNNSFGFGGNDSTLIFSRYSPAN
ncbi:MAG: beta-ketoacyl-[acyl-carrier-protein] synthase family protein, partial [Muribaculaceae bacterium]|nr:beta-ketoacyl-[acyl-carrier-protein] synthase family protein [Muribaculaceae bacterium]